MTTHLNSAPGSSLSYHQDLGSGFIMLMVILKITEYFLVAVSGNVHYGFSLAKHSFMATTARSSKSITIFCK